MKKTCKHDNKEKTIFQQRLIDLRKEKGFKNQKQLADKIGVSRDCIVQWENDETRQPALDKLILLADTFEVSLDYLIGRSKYTQIGNEELSEMTGLSDKAINRLKQINESDTDSFKNQLQAIKGNKQVLISKNFLIMPILNFLIESKYFSKFLERFFNYSLDWYSNPAIKEDDSFRFIQDNNLYFSCNAGNPADNIPLEMDNDFRKTVSKNMMILSLDKISEDYKKLFLSAMKK